MHSTTTHILVDHLDDPNPNPHPSPTHIHVYGGGVPVFMKAGGGAAARVTNGGLSAGYAVTFGGQPSPESPTFHTPGGRTFSLAGQC